MTESRDENTPSTVPRAGDIYRSISKMDGLRASDNEAMVRALRVEAALHSHDELSRTIRELERARIQLAAGYGAAAKAGLKIAAILDAEEARGADR